MSTRLLSNLALAAMLCFCAMHPSTANNANLHAIPNDRSVKSIFDVLAQKEILEVTLTTDLTHLIENRKKEIDQAATISYENEAGGAVSYDIKITPRGKYRRRICDFPPLKLKFPKTTLTAQGLSTHNDLKLVTHCLDNKTTGNEQLLKEFLAYRLYNLLTDKSYRVQLLQITYVDSEGKAGKQKRYGFLIEDTDEMAERLGGLECDQCMNPNPATVDAGSEQLMSAFQYMIGNADWNLAMLRNVKIVQPAVGTSTLVPYDFDFSALVSPTYARVNTNFGLTSVKERIFLGYPSSDEDLWATINYLRSKRAELVAEIRKFKFLTNTSRLEMIAYLDEFFEITTQLESKRVSGIYELLKKPSRFLNRNEEEEAPSSTPKGASAGR